jgi:hypothetical protein
MESYREFFKRFYPSVCISHKDLIRVFLNNKIEGKMINRKRLS